MSTDDVLDFMVMEALAAKENREVAKAHKQQRQKEWLRDHRKLGKLS